MRILFISQLFDPENSIKGLDFARRLTALGHEVEVVTTFPSYPGGKIYAGYKQRLKQIEVVEGIRIVRIPTYINHGTSALKRMLSYLSFGVSGGLYAIFSKKKIDIIYAYYPPVIVGILALVVGLFRRIPYVYDVQDLWPEALVATGGIKKGGWIERWVEIFCKLIYRRAARIVVLSDGYRKALINKGVMEDKIVRVFNWCDESRVKPSSSVKSALIDPNFFNILYAGNLGTAQSLDSVIEAARLLHESKDAPRVRFIFLGSGVSEGALKKSADDYGLENVKFLPRVSADEVGEFLCSADVLLVHLADEPVFEITIPQKTQAYLLAKRPILMAVRGEAGDIVRAAGAGLVVEPCEPVQLVEAVVKMSNFPKKTLEEMAENGICFYEKYMSMDVGVIAVDGMLKQVVEKGTAHD